MSKICIISMSSPIAANVITVSIGVASMIPGKNQAKEELIDLADKALYLAKNDGKNCTRVA